MTYFIFQQILYFTLLNNTIAQMSEAFIIEPPKNKIQQLTNSAGLFLPVQATKETEKG